MTEMTGYSRELRKVGREAREELRAISREGLAQRTRREAAELRAPSSEGLAQPARPEAETFRYRTSGDYKTQQWAARTAQQERLRVQQERIRDESLSLVNQALDNARDAAADGRRIASVSDVGLAGPYVADTLRRLGFKGVREGSRSWNEGDLDCSESWVTFKF